MITSLTSLIITEYGVHLTEISFDPNVDWPVRQLASVLLKHHIDIHWTRKIEKFQEPEITKDAKLRIRNILLHGKDVVTLYNTVKNYFPNSLNQGFLEINKLSL